MEPERQGSLNRFDLPVCSSPLSEKQSNQANFIGRSSVKIGQTGHLFRLRFGSSDAFERMKTRGSSQRGWLGFHAVDERTATPDGAGAALQELYRTCISQGVKCSAGIAQGHHAGGGSEVQAKQLEIIKLNKASEKTEQREKEREEERVERPKMIVIYTDPDGKVIRDERVGGKVVKREVLEEDTGLS